MFPVQARNRWLFAISMVFGCLSLAAPSWAGPPSQVLVFGDTWAKMQERFTLQKTSRSLPASFTLQRHKGHADELGVVRQAHGFGPLGWFIISMPVAAVNLLMLIPELLMLGRYSAGTRMGWGIAGIVVGGLGLLAEVVSLILDVPGIDVVFGMMHVAAFVFTGAVIALSSLHIFRALKMKRGQRHLSVLPIVVPDGQSVRAGFVMQGTF